MNFKLLSLLKRRKVQYVLAITAGTLSLLLVVVVLFAFRKAEGSKKKLKSTSSNSPFESRNDESVSKSSSTDGEDEGKPSARARKNPGNKVNMATGRSGNEKQADETNKEPNNIQKNLDDKEQKVEESLKPLLDTISKEKKDESHNLNVPVFDTHKEDLNSQSNDSDNNIEVANNSQINDAENNANLPSGVVPNVNISHNHKVPSRDDAQTNQKADLVEDKVKVKVTSDLNSANPTLSKNLNTPNTVNQTLTQKDADNRSLIQKDPEEDVHKAEIQKDDNSSAKLGLASKISRFENMNRPPPATKTTNTKQTTTIKNSKPLESKNHIKSKADQHDVSKLQIEKAFKQFKSEAKDILTKLESTLEDQGFKKLMEKLEESINERPQEMPLEDDVIQLLKKTSNKEEENSVFEAGKKCRHNVGI